MDEEPRTGVSPPISSSNPGAVFKRSEDLKQQLSSNSLHWSKSAPEAFDGRLGAVDTLLLRFFPDLSEHIELIRLIRSHGIQNLVFLQPSRMHRFYFADDAHGWLDAYETLGIKVYWNDQDSGELFVHTYKGRHGFFIREELVKRLGESTIVAFYGSALSLDQQDVARITNLVDRLASHFGPNFAVLTGGGPGVMHAALERARNHGALTGACFLELEAQPTIRGVDFFNTFRETSRHNRQKWFRAADLCIFSIGGVGTLEEIGIELCNLKLGIRPRVPHVFYNTRFWRHIRAQLDEMVQSNRAPAWLLDHLVFTDDPEEIASLYKCRFTRNRPKRVDRLT